jgi:hypothetical protein
MSIFNRKSFSASNASNAPRAYGGMTMPKVWTCVATQLAALALLLASGSASAWQCDFLTGGGFIIRTPPFPEASGAHGNFGVGGACKNGGDGHGLWGHLEYIDHGTGTSTLTTLPLNAHWITITDYREWSTSSSPKGRPIGARLICGTARTNQAYGDVNFVVYAEDKGEPGDDDKFEIRLTQPVGMNVPQHTVYTTEHDSDNTLGGAAPAPGGGNIQLHKPNNSFTGIFGFAGDGKCPAFDYCNGASGC